MKRLITFLFLTLAASACASQSDFDDHIQEFEALRANHELLIQQLDGWADELTAWGQETGNAICDIVDNNGPLSKYSTATQNYCGPGDPPNRPPDPPDWGAA